MEKLLWLCLLLYLLWNFPVSLSWKSLTFLDLRHNMLEEQLPPSICGSENLEYLLLAENKLSGTIPQCLGSFSNRLKVLDLQKNSFHGMIATTFKHGNQLRTLNLNRNQLEGPLPRSLINCKNLQVLDVGNNKIRDASPVWLETLPELHVLILKSNRFQGPIATSKTKFPFPKLRIFDISHNEFTSILPADLLKNFRAMTCLDSRKELEYLGNRLYYVDSVTLVMKGRKLSLSEPSSFSLQLIYLRTSFQGFIPATTGELTALESLDLSWNQLQGQIPWQLTKLTFFAFFSLSENHLFGRIPQGKQFGTFSSDLYKGNLALRGFPLKDCGEVEATQSPANAETSQRGYFGILGLFPWESVVSGYCFGMAAGLCIGGLLFTGKPRWFPPSVAKETHKWSRSRGKNERCS